jgi:uncharacterized protein YukE
VSIDNASLLVGDGLADAGPNINGTAQGISDELNTLIGLLTPLQDYWTGNAAALYESYQEEWNAAAAGLFGGEGTEGVLGAIAQAMNVAYGNYSDAEWANIQTWQSS